MSPTLQLGCCCSGPPTRVRARASPDCRRATQDADICPEWSNGTSHLAASLTELRARLKIGEGSVETLEIAIDARTIHGLAIGARRTAAGDLDVLLGVPGGSRRELVRYVHLVEDATELEVDGLRVLVAPFDDIIRLKEIADRAKDRAALEEPRSLQDLSGPDWPAFKGVRRVARTGGCSAEHFRMMGIPAERAGRTSWVASTQCVECVAAGRVAVSGGVMVDVGVRQRPNTGAKQRGRAALSSTAGNGGASRRLACCGCHRGAA